MQEEEAENAIAPVNSSTSSSSSPDPEACRPAKRLKNQSWDDTQDGYPDGLCDRCRALILDDRLLRVTSRSSHSDKDYSDTGHVTEDEGSSGVGSMPNESPADDWDADSSSEMNASSPDDETSESQYVYSPEAELCSEYSLNDTLPELPILSESSAKGCGVCRILASAARKGAASIQESLKIPQLRRFSTFGARYLWENPGYHEWSEGLSILAIKVNFRGDDTSLTSEVFFEIECAEGKSAKWLNINRRPLDLVASSEKNAAKFKSWLSECKSSHKTCNREKATKKLPTRLLAIKGTNEEDLRVIICSDHPTLGDCETTPYVALSHCWGKGTTPLSTERLSLPARMEGIPLETMPRTYRDAVLLTRAVGIQYIWIDSLCIIQDNKDDWEKESNTMARIYRNACFTLCALVDSCDDGFLHREPSARIPFRSSVNDSIRGMYSFRETWQRWVPGSYYGLEVDFLESDLIVAKWNTRGWTLQEEWFSSILLQCTKRMICYSCNEKFCSEDEFYHSGKEWRHDFLTILERRPNDFYSWYSTVQEYSDRLLTYEEDRLPAVSALAAVFAEETGSTYIAGLWAQDIHDGLFWEKLCPDSNFYDLADFINHLANNPLFIAPSWSWASQNENVGWARGKREGVAECELIEAHSEVDGLNPYGRIRKAHLVVSGRINWPKDLNFERSIKDSWQVKSENVFVGQWCLDFGAVEEKLGSNSKSKWEGKKSDDGVAMFLLARKPAEDGYEPDLGDFNKYGSLWDGRLLFGLLLYPTGVQDEYRRIGIFYAPYWSAEAYEFFETVPSRKVKLV